MQGSNNFYPVILAGGRGTRFWPLSRKTKAKQLLALDDPKRTMIQQTVDRLLPLSEPKNVWIITNAELRPEIVNQLPELEKNQIVAEPAGRNTAPAIGLAAFILARKDPGAVLGLFPSDHVIADEKAFQRNVQRAIDIAADGPNIVVMGIKPTRAETGYGYIEAGGAVHENVLRVNRFREKPNQEMAEQFVEAGNYYWNSGMFIWRASTLVQALREHLKPTADLLEKVAESYGKPEFDEVFGELYPKVENISVDYAVAEPVSAKGEKSGLYCIPSDIGWNDLGSWTALYEHRSSKLAEGANVINGEGRFELNASGNYVHAPGKFVATVGVEDLVVVDTGDALLITTKANAQDVGKVVKHLDEKNLTKLV